MSLEQLPNERALLYRVTEGDTGAFELLYRHYRNKAYTISLTYINDPATAEDVLQDFFLKLWNNREKLLEVENFDNYFFIMLRNMLISALRSKERQQKIKTYVNQFSFLHSDPQQQSEAYALAQTIQHALQQLPEKQQGIYRMSREEGLNHEQIGSILHISPRTVSNTITLVLNYLRNTLREQDYLVEILLLQTALYFF